MAFFVRSEEKVLSGNDRVKESPRKELVSTDAEEALANAEVRGRALRSEQWKGFCQLHSGLTGSCGRSGGGSRKEGTSIRRGS